MATLPSKNALNDLTGGYYSYWTDGTTEGRATVAVLLGSTDAQAAAASFSSLALGTDLAVIHGGTGASTAEDARTNLGLAIGTNVQEYSATLDALIASPLTASTAASTYLTQASAASTYLTQATAASTYLTIASAASTYQPLDADLTAIAALSSADGNFIVGSATGWVAESGATARTSLGLGTGDSPTFAGLTLTGGIALSATTVVSLDGADRVYFRKNGKTDNGLGDQFLFGDFDGWSTSGGGLDIGLANNFHAWWGGVDPVRVEFEADNGEMQFYIEGASGEDAWYGLQEGATHHWSFGSDASDSGNLKFVSAFGISGNPEFTIGKNGTGSSFGYVTNLHRSISDHRTLSVRSDVDAFLQIVANNVGSVGTGIFLSNMEGAADGRHWVIQHRGTTASNAFQIGYDTTAADGENIATGAATYFAISTAGAFSLNGTTTIASDLTLASGSITSASGAISFGDENLSTTGTFASGGATISGLLNVEYSNNGEARIRVDNNSTGANAYASYYLEAFGNSFEIKTYGDGTAKANVTELVSAAGGSVFNFLPASTQVLSLSSSGATVTGTLGVTGNLTVDTNTLYVDAAANAVRIGTTSATGHGEEVLRLVGANNIVANFHKDSTNSSYLQFTNNSTGTANSVGVIFGMGSAEEGLILNQNATHLSFWTNAAERFRVAATAANILVKGTTSPASMDGGVVLFNGTAPSAGATNAVALYSKDLSAGNTMLGIYTEGTPVGSGTPTQNRTIAVEVNGTTLYILASTTAS